MLITLIMKAIITYLRRIFFISKAQQKKSTLSKTYQLVSISIVGMKLNQYKDILKINNDKYHNNSYKTALLYL